MPETKWNKERHNRCNLHSDYSNYWDTKAEALDYLVQREEKKIREAENRIIEARKSLEILSSMNP
jgi:hypothetical protein